MTCLMLAMQSAFCTGAVLIAKSLGLINLQAFDVEAAKKWFPISFMLASVIYTGSKSLVSFPQFLDLVAAPVISLVSNTPHFISFVTCDEY